MAEDFLATNNKGSKFLFEERTDYKERAFNPDVGVPEDYSMVRDFWSFDSTLYGRIDRTQNPIVPRGTKLVSIPSHRDNTLYVFDFVADAFNALRQTAANKINDGCLPQENRDGTIEPYIGAFDAYRAYENPADTFRTVLTTYYDSYRRNVFMQGRTRYEVLGFEDFVNSFGEFLGIAKDRFPTLLSTTILSRQCSLLTSALAIDISNLDASSDPQKEDNFIDNPRMKLFLNLASEYGFYIDKNVPWRLVANLQSSLMKEYIVNRFPDYSGLPSLFEEYYQQAIVQDVGLLKSNMIILYNRLVAQRPKEVETTYTRGCKTTTVLERRRITREEVDLNYPNSYWIGIYVRLRNYNSPIDYSQNELEKIIRNAQDLERAVDTRKAVEYIQYKFRGLVALKGSRSYTSLESGLRDKNLGSDEFDRAVQAAAKSINTTIY